MKSCVCVLGPIPSLLVLRSPRGDQGLLQRYMIFLFNPSLPILSFYLLFFGVFVDRLALSFFLLCPSFLFLLLLSPFYGCGIPVFRVFVKGG